MGELEGEGPRTGLGLRLSQLFSSNANMPLWGPLLMRSPLTSGIQALRWAKGQAEQPCPACPQEPLGSAQATSPGTAATSLLPSRKARSEAAAAGPTPNPLTAGPAQGLSLWPRGPRRRP